MTLCNHTDLFCRGFLAAEEALVAYSKRECQQISFRLLSRFPQELIDICYEYLLDDETVRNIVQQVRYHVNTVIPYTLRPFVRPPKGPIHLIDPSFVHPVMAAEILALAAKKPSHRAYLELQRPSDVNRILNMEPYGLGVRASDFFGDIYLEWNFVRTAEEAQEHKSMNPHIMLYSPAAFSDIHKIMLDIPTRIGRSLNVVVRIPSFQKDEIEQFKLSIEELKARGFRKLVFNVTNLRRTWQSYLASLPADARIEKNWRNYPSRYKSHLMVYHHNF